uniref:hypothetical protein n=1 Tax=Helicobacter typhlonius TaxID=76936 RepID=UPI003A5C7BA0
MAKMRKCALLVLCAIMLGCGDSKDSQKKQSTQEQTQESKAQGQDIARDSASVRELLGLQENSTAFYVLKGKVGDKEQVGYLSIWEDKKRDIDIESSIENIENDPEKGRVVYLKQNSKDFPLMIAI